MDFTSKNSKIAFFVRCHSFGDLGVTYKVHPWLVGKRVVDFQLVLIERFYARGAIDARVIAIIVCLSVCHTPVLYQNG